MEFYQQLKQTRPSSTQVQEQKNRAGQGPAINKAQQTANAAQETANDALSLIPIGAVMRYPCLNPPADPRWVFEDGRTLPIIDYPDLYAVMGTTHNRGDEPAGTFRISDSRGRVGVGAGQGSGLTNRTLGSVFGTETHALTEAQTGPHGHSGSTSSDSHFHGGDNYLSNYGYRDDFYVGGSTRAITSLTNVSTGTTDSDTHSHGLNVNSAGGGQAHPNTQPSLVTSYILRVL